MKIFTIAAAAAITVLAGCTTDSMETSATMSKPASTVVEPLLGKRLVGENVTFIINADGTMGGTFRDEAIVGTYKATATESCSIYTAPKQLSDREYCSTPVIRGNTVVFNRRDGSKSDVYRIEG